MMLLGVRPREFLEVRPDVFGVVECALQSAVEMGESGIDDTVACRWPDRRLPRRTSFGPG